MSFVIWRGVEKCVADRKAFYNNTRPLDWINIFVILERKTLLAGIPTVFVIAGDNERDADVRKTYRSP